MQIRVLESGDDLFDIGCMGLCVQTILCYQAVSGLDHGFVHGVIDLFVKDGVHDGGKALDNAQIGGDAVACVQGEELSLDVGIQVVYQVHTFDLGKLALEGALFNVPLEVLFYDHVDGVLGTDGWNDSVNGAVREADVLVRISLFLVCQQGIDGCLELRGCADGVLACDEIEGLLAACRDAGADAFYHGRSYAGKDDQADSCGNKVCLGNGRDDGGTVGHDAVHARDLNVSLFHVHDMNSVFLVCGDPVNDYGIDVAENDLVAGFCQDHADKAASDVACAEHYC